MTVKVSFPDGSIREVRSQLKELKSREIGRGHSTFMNEPASDPEWLFVPVVGGWAARPRR